MVSNKSIEDSSWARLLTRAGHNVALAAFVAVLVFQLFGPGEMSSMVLASMFAVQLGSIVYIGLYRFHREQQMEREAKLREVEEIERREKEEQAAIRAMREEEHAVRMAKLEDERMMVAEKRADENERRRLERERLEVELNKAKEEAIESARLEYLKIEQVLINEKNAKARADLEKTTNACLVEATRLTEQRMRYKQVEFAIKMQAERGRVKSMPVPIGTDSEGDKVFLDLMQSPNLLVGGATGQGKSVFLHGLIEALTALFTNGQVNLVLVDAKRAEFSSYQTLSYLCSPVLNDSVKLGFVLRWLKQEIYDRLSLIRQFNCKDLEDYIANARGKTKYPPRIVLIVDELFPIGWGNADDITSDIESLIGTFSVTAGIHVIVATQRVNNRNVKRLINTSAFSRVAFKLTSKRESTIFIGEQGAERLVGAGDLLFKRGTCPVVRLKARNVAQKDIDKIVHRSGASRG